MIGRWISRIRDLLPKRYQVPAKYWYGRLRGTLEAEMMLVAMFVQEGDHVIDVGGNRGIYTYQLCRAGAELEVFEPNPVCYSVLAAWAEGKAKVRLHGVALSSQDGSAVLHIPVDEAGVEHDAAGSVENSGFGHSRSHAVRLSRLDNFGFENISFIKIDVEGHESSVLAGASQTIAHSAPALLIEIEQRHIAVPIQAVFDEVLSLGYRGFFLEADGLVALENFDVMRDQSMENFGKSNAPYINNFLFLHRRRLASGDYAFLSLVH